MFGVWILEFEICLEFGNWLLEIMVDYPTVVDVLRHGGIIVYPTDTAYAIGCDATKEKAVQKIFEIKGRSESKTLSLIVGSRAMAEEWLEFSPKAHELADRFWPGPLGLILSIKKQGLARAAIEGGYAGARVPDNEIAAVLSREAGVPLVATSANASGQGPCYSVDDVRASLGANASKVDAFVDGGVLENRGVSTMVKVWDNDSVEVIREGAIPASEL